MRHQFAFTKQMLDNDLRRSAVFGQGPLGVCGPVRLGEPPQMALDELQLDRGDRQGGGDYVALFASLLFHVALLVGLGVVPALFDTRSDLVTLWVPVDETIDNAELLPRQEFHIRPPEVLAVGADSLRDRDVARSGGQQVAIVPELPTPAEVVPIAISPLRANQVVEIPTALHIENMPVRGAVGQGTTGALGAIDRITNEIVLSLEERPTLVVWLFDQSASLYRQRKEIHDRLDRIYSELGILDAAGTETAGSRRDAPLLSAVVAFGSGVHFLTERPTQNVAEIKERIASISLDDSGIERVFTAVHMAADRYKPFRRGGGKRNVMLIVFTDEAGEDQNGVDRTVQLCRRYAMPVYVVGVPAPFGQRETLVKWVDPDPKYDQRPQRGVVEQGPESLLSERVQLSFFGGRDPGPIDSGFGPFALTRLCYESGGIYFTVHPNRNIDKRVGWRETETYSAHLSHFFDEEVMRKYRPDYVSSAEYSRRVQQNRSRQALVKAAQVAGIGQMKSPRLRFERRDAAQLNNTLSEAQKAAAALEPALAGLYEILASGEVDREQEAALRWQAGYDLATGRVLAAKVRTEGYNAMLAQAKRGLAFTDSKNNTWVLTPDPSISSSSRLAREAEDAQRFLQRVIEEHAGTPWALLAERELKTPLGWRWEETYTNFNPPERSVARAGTPRPGRDDRARRISAPPPRRPPPKL